MRQPGDQRGMRPRGASATAENARSQRGPASKHAPDRFSGFARAQVRQAPRPTGLGLPAIWQPWAGGLFVGCFLSPGRLQLSPVCGDAGDGVVGGAGWVKVRRRQASRKKGATTRQGTGAPTQLWGGRVSAARVWFALWQRLRTLRAESGNPCSRWRAAPPGRRRQSGPAGRHAGRWRAAHRAAAGYPPRPCIEPNWPLALV